MGLKLGHTTVEVYLVGQIKPLEKMTLVFIPLTLDKLQRHVLWFSIHRLLVVRYIFSFIFYLEFMDNWSLALSAITLQNSNASPSLSSTLVTA